MKSKGFTIVELLIALAIIGILASILSWNLLGSYRTVQMRDAATQIAADLKRGRSTAQQTSTKVTVLMPGTEGGNTYTVGSNPTVTLQNGIRIVCKTNCNSSSGAFAYQAPYGEVTPTGLIYTVVSPYSNAKSFDIRLTGLTGRPMIVVTP